jgi:hypothetical protein
MRFEQSNLMNKLYFLKMSRKKLYLHSSLKCNRGISGAHAFLEKSQKLINFYVIFES